MAVHLTAKIVLEDWSQESNLSFYGTFYLFAVIMAISMPVMYILLPETKDVALEEVHHFFSKQKSIFYIDLGANLKMSKCDEVTKMWYDLTEILFKHTQLFYK